MGLTPALASRRLAALERELGARLAHRTTRSFALTDEGASFLPHAESILEAEAMARASVQGQQLQATGLLRVGAPFPLARRVISPLMGELLMAHPELRINLQVTDTFVDIVEAGLDVVLRVAHLEDSSLIARRLAPSPRVLCAAPEYLERRGRPERVSDLVHHDCLVCTRTDHWLFDDDGVVRQVRVAGRLTSNSHLPLRAACVAGAGIALYSLWDAVDDLEAGRLVQLDLDLPPRSDLSIWALYPTRVLVPAKVRVFIDAVYHHLSAHR